jgi:hypothetical protein
LDFGFWIRVDETLLLLLLLMMFAVLPAFLIHKLSFLEF